MADRKFGRLFTEADVRRFVAEFIEGYMEVNDGPDLDHSLSRFTSTFPADEPLFLLRGQDTAVSDALVGGQDYEDACRDAGASTEHLAAIQAAADDIHAWQRANPDRVKVPD